MSSDSLAVFRKSMGSDLGALAEEHYRHEYVASSIGVNGIPVDPI